MKTSVADSMAGYHGMHGHLIYPFNTVQNYPVCDLDRDLDC